MDVFTRAVFNINAGTDGSIAVRAEDVFGTMFQQTFFVDANGANFFTVEAINDQFIT